MRARRAMATPAHGQRDKNLEFLRRRDKSDALSHTHAGAIGAFTHPVKYQSVSQHRRRACIIVHGTTPQPDS